jgi:hypothetical protein
MVVTISMAFFGHRLSGAGAYQELSGYVGHHIAPNSVYWRHIVPPGIGWDVTVAIGALLGALIASLLSGSFRFRTMPDRQWIPAFGPSVILRWSLAFIGSLLTEVGGSISGGCTASLAVSGGAVLVPAAFLFMAGMFGTGTPVAFGVNRLRLHRRKTSRVPHA